MSLVTLANIKVYLGIASDDTSQDALITMYQEQIEQAVINYCDTDFTLKTETREILDGFRADVITPKNYPITAVSAVYVGVNADGTGGTQLDAQNDYHFSESAIYLHYSHTPFARGVVAVSYSWGYDGVPADVKMAIYHSVKASLQRHSRNVEDVRSRSKGDESESFGGTGKGGIWDNQTGLPNTALAMLQNYKTLEFPSVGMAQRNT